MNFEEKAALFLKTIADAAKLLGVSLSHEDAQGAFIVEPYDASNIEWLMAAQIRGWVMVPAGTTEDSSV